jgi:hypothetical protein
MKKKNKIFNKAIVLGLFISFIGIGFLPSVAVGNKSKQGLSTVTFYTFDKTSTKKCKVELPTVVVEDISRLFESLKKGITNDPFSAETESLKNDFVEILDKNNVFPRSLTKDDVISLLNPWWNSWCEDNNPFSRDKVLPAQYSHRGSAFLCSIAGGGGGLMFPPIMLPRPRLATVWAVYTSYAGTVASNLYTGHGFAAIGPQFGMALGFWGIGLSFAVPGEPAIFGFGGYALAAWVMADYVENYPPNRAPIISEENPTDGVWDVPVSLSELSFRISDPDKDRMSYWVTTDPDIGSGEGHLKNDGVYTIPIDGLEYDKSYSWTIRVSDGTNTVEKKFGFFSEIGPPFNPFDEGWLYRKQIIVNHSQVNGDLIDFPVLISVVDSDLANKTQADGDDILFMDGSGVASKLNHEIEKYDDSSGELIAWVNIPSLSSVDDTVLYVYYGNALCSSQQLGERVWDSDFLTVLHMNDLSGNPYDSTRNHEMWQVKNGGFLTYHATGQVGYAIKGEYAVNDGNRFENFGMDWTVLNAVTIEWWCAPDDVTIQTHYLFGADGSNREDIRCIYSNKEGADGNGWFNNWDDGTHRVLDGRLYNWNNGEFHYGAAIMDNTGSNYQGLYTDGTLTVSTKPSDFNFANLNNQYYIGSRSPERGKDSTLNGCLDEFRISKVRRSDAWISTSYNTMNDPSSFFSVGPEESGL